MAGALGILQGFLTRLRERFSVRNFWRSCSGATAVEFGFVAPMIIGLIFSVIEVGLYFYKVTAVEESVRRAARVVKTGQSLFPSPGPDGCQIEKECFFDEICSPIKAFGSCATNLSVEVTAFDSFADLASDSTVVACPGDAGFSSQNSSFQKGVTSGIVRVRVCYEIYTVNPIIGFKLSQTPGGKRALISSYVFRNEPFDGWTPDGDP